MKCVGAANPPCERCTKAGRKCEFLQPGQTPPAQPRRRPKSLPQQTSGRVDQNTGGSAGDRSHGAAANSHHLDNVLNRGSVSNSYNTPSWTPITPEPSTHGAAKKASELPSAYSASRLVTVMDESHFPTGSSVIYHHQASSKRRRTGTHSLEPGDRSHVDISQRDMEQLLELYVPYINRSNY